MRQFEVAPGGYTPKHSHPYEHEVFVLEGNGVVLEGDREHTLKPGDVVFVVPGEVHQFRNTGPRRSSSCAWFPTHRPTSRDRGAGVRTPSAGKRTVVSAASFSDSAGRLSASALRSSS